MAIQIENKLTPVTYPALITAMRSRCPNLTPNSRVILAAQIGFETALKYCHCYNLGNAKKTDRDGLPYFCQFACGEEVPLTLAQEEKRKFPDLVEFRGASYARGSVVFQSVWVKPPHPWTSFRAFQSLEDGLADHLRLLQSPRYSIAWVKMSEGNLDGFVAELGRAGYFTANANVYLGGVQKEYHRCRGTLMGRETIGQGEDNPESAVKDWQQALGFPAEKCDGRWGPATRAATVAWQTRHGLVADGIMGPVSWSVAFPGAEVDA